MKLLVLFLIATAIQASTQDLMKDFTVSNAQFTADIYKELTKSNSGNIIVCPLSVSTVLALVHAGARGNTATEISSALHLPEDTKKIQELFTNLHPFLQHHDKYILSSANKVYLRDGFTISDEFKSTAINSFHSEIESMNFDKKAEAVSEMNKWVEQKTHDKIKELVKPDYLNERTVAVLLNAMYFQGSWLNRFLEQQTAKKPFYLNNQKHLNIDMMAQTKYLKYHESRELNAKFLELAYAGDGASMTFVLPNDKEGLSSLEDHMADVLTSSGFRTEYVHAQIPKFKIESTIDFNSILQKLGIVDAFAGNADFSGIGANKTPIKISKVVQKAFIDIDEKGTTAAAASALMLEAMSMPPPPKQFIADHPFIYFIKINDVVVFAGRYLLPEI